MASASCRRRKTMSSCSASLAAVAAAAAAELRTCSDCTSAVDSTRRSLRFASANAYDDSTLPGSITWSHKSTAQLKMPEKRNQPLEQSPGARLRPRPNRLRRGHPASAPPSKNRAPSPTSPPARRRFRMNGNNRIEHLVLLALSSAHSQVFFSRLLRNLCPYSIIWVSQTALK